MLNLFVEYFQHSFTCTRIFDVPVNPILGLYHKSIFFACVTKSLPDDRAVHKNRIPQQADDISQVLAYHDMGDRDPMKHDPGGIKDSQLTLLDSVLDGPERGRNLIHYFYDEETRWPYIVFYVG
jgi:hypothetical protein